MIKSLKLFSSVIKKNEAAKTHSFCAPSMADIIKFNSKTIILSLLSNSSSHIVLPSTTLPLTL